MPPPPQLVLHARWEGAMEPDEMEERDLGPGREWEVETERNRGSGVETEHWCRAVAICGCILRPNKEQRTQ